MINSKTESANVVSWFSSSQLTPGTADTVVRYNVPMFNQGAHNLCAIYCQVGSKTITVYNALWCKLETTPKFIFHIAVPSMIGCAINPSEQIYYSLPWER